MATAVGGKYYETEHDFQREAFGWDHLDTPPSAPEKPAGEVKSELGTQVAQMMNGEMPKGKYHGNWMPDYEVESIPDPNHPSGYRWPEGAVPDNWMELGTSKDNKYLGIKTMPDKKDLISDATPDNIKPGQQYAMMDDELRKRTYYGRGSMEGGGFTKPKAANTNTAEPEGNPWHPKNPGGPGQINPTPYEEAVIAQSVKNAPWNKFSPGYKPTLQDRQTQKDFIKSEIETETKAANRIPEGLDPKMAAKLEELRGKILGPESRGTIPKDVMGSIKKLDNLGFDRPNQALNAIRDDFQKGGLDRVKKNWDIQPQDELHLQRILNYIKEKP